MKPLRVLGLSAFYHDSAAAIVEDGVIIAAAQEERFTRVKHDPSFPTEATAFCLQKAGCKIQDIDYVVFYEKPRLKFERLLHSSLASAPRGRESFCRMMGAWLTDKLFLEYSIKKALGGSLKNKIIFTKHHISHAASAFYPSPFKEAAVLTMDGVGEWDTSTIAVGTSERIELKKHLKFPHSVGLMYSAFTDFCGFKVNSGEYKLMGLAPYGKPRYADLIYEHLVHVCEDGSIALNLDYFTFHRDLKMTGSCFAELFDGPARKRETPITEREADIAASIQVVVEDIVCRMARYASELTGSRQLCMAGGVALNCVANGKLQRRGIFDDIWVQPAAGDAGGALGAALYVAHHQKGIKRQISKNDNMQGARLGKAYRTLDVRNTLDSAGATYTVCEDEDLLLKKVAECIDDGLVVGWFQGPMEFGPRALGSRSILGDPRRVDMQSRMNLKIKYRESFRPFAPSVLEEDVSLYFEYDKMTPYMLMVADVVGADTDSSLGHFDMSSQLKEVRSSLPAVTHVDGSARVQSVSLDDNPRYHKLLQAFKEKTGCGVLINTSFNIRGEPIVCSPEDAYRCFQATDMDVLILENCILYKENQPAMNEAKKEEHQRAFALD